MSVGVGAGRCASVNGGGSHLKDGLLRGLCLARRPEPYWSIEALMTCSSLAFYARQQMAPDIRSLPSSPLALFGSAYTCFYLDLTAAYYSRLASFYRRSHGEAAHWASDLTLTLPPWPLIKSHAANQTSAGSATGQPLCKSDFHTFASPIYFFFRGPSQPFPGDL